MMQCGDKFTLVFNTVTLKDMSKIDPEQTTTKQNYSTNITNK